MLNSLFRFHSRGSIRYIYKNGHIVRSRYMNLKTVPVAKRTPRFSVVVSKKVYKGAVGRNRMRRRIYEIIKNEQLLLKPQQDTVIIILSSEIIHMPHLQLKEVVRQLFSEAYLYK